MDKKARIYVSGHTGMVGTSVVNLLREKGYNNLILKTIEEFDLHNQKLVDEFMAKERPEYVFHFAARVGGIKANIENPAEFLYDNLMIEANVINASYKHGVKKLLYLGSSCIYPRQCRQPMKEEYLLSGKLEPTNEGYAIAKIAGLKLCSYYNKQYNTNF
ncbi:MAG TPA: NAD-dependent epimerase/dehydratase family protein, partial [Candidatus Omnitrophota bacterium]|nr:NAD-dependent epimerase/dehydratase family protein [Candidatus Omnitrophota bacterium]